MTTSPSSQEPKVTPLVIYPAGVAQVEAQRKRLGITEEQLERSRNASLERKF